MRHFQQCPLQLESTEKLRELFSSSPTSLAQDDNHQKLHRCMTTLFTRGKNIENTNQLTAATPEIPTGIQQIMGRLKPQNGDITSLSLPPPLPLNSLILQGAKHPPFQLKSITQSGSQSLKMLILQLVPQHSARGNWGGYMIIHTSAGLIFHLVKGSGRRDRQTDIGPDPGSWQHCAQHSSGNGMGYDLCLLFLD